MLTTKNAGDGEGLKVEAAGDSDAQPNAIRRYSRVQLCATKISVIPSWFFALAVLACLILTGCKPPGPRALLDGEKLISRGQYDKAVERLKTATSLMESNAEAWNYLGLAYHQAGQPNEAVDAYKKALSLDQNLVEVHYNLGCLWLEQKKPDLAKAELTAYTLHRDRSPEGYLKLGEAQLALHDLAGAEKSFNQVRQLDAQNPEALNELGIVQMQRNRPTEAAQFFNAALRAKTDYAVAMLNLAVVVKNIGDGG
jgi:Flp pilus assembly protein TadD